MVDKNRYMTKTMTDISPTDIPLKEYYVYLLMDPKDDSVFYIGKGTGKRAEAHMREARESDSETRKLEKIREIESREGTNNKLKIRVIARFDSEDKAYAVESVLMHWMYNFEHLTNIQPGHGHKYIRRQGDLATIVDGLDLNRVVNLGGNRNTGYLQDKMDSIVRHNVLDSADELRAKLLEHIKNDLISKAMLWERGRWVAILVKITPNINLALQFSHTGNNRITFNVVPTDESLDTRNLFSKIMIENNLEPKNRGRYAKLKTWEGCSIPVNEFDKIIKRIQEAFECFKSDDCLTS